MSRERRRMKKTKFRSIGVETTENVNQRDEKDVVRKENGIEDKILLSIIERKPFKIIKKLGKRKVKWNFKKTSFLQWAVIFGNLDVVEGFLNCERYLKPIKRTSFTDEDGSTTNRTDSDIVRIELEVRGTDHEYPLLNSRDLDIVQEIFGGLSTGKNPNKYKVYEFNFPGSSTLLHIAATQRWFDVVKFFMDDEDGMGIDMAKDKDDWGNFPIDSLRFGIPIVSYHIQERSKECFIILKKSLVSVSESNGEIESARSDIPLIEILSRMNEFLKIKDKIRELKERKNFINFRRGRSMEKEIDTLIARKGLIPTIGSTMNKIKENEEFLSDFFLNISEYVDFLKKDHGVVTRREYFFKDKNKVEKVKKKVEEEEEEEGEEEEPILPNIIKSLKEEFVKHGPSLAKKLSKMKEKNKEAVRRSSEIGAILKKKFMDAMESKVSGGLTDAKRREMEEMKKIFYRKSFPIFYNKAFGNDESEGKKYNLCPDGVLPILKSIMNEDLFKKNNFVHEGFKKLFETRTVLASDRYEYNSKMINFLKNTLGVIQELEKEELVYYRCVGMKKSVNKDYTPEGKFKSLEKSMEWGGNCFSNLLLGGVEVEGRKRRVLLCVDILKSEEENEGEQEEEEGLTNHKKENLKRVKKGITDIRIRWNPSNEIETRVIKMSEYLVFVFDSVNEEYYISVELEVHGNMKEKSMKGSSSKN